MKRICLVMCCLFGLSGLALAQDAESEAEKAKQQAEAQRLERNRKLMAELKQDEEANKNTFAELMTDKGWQERFNAGTFYVEIPLIGVFGKEVLRTPVESALEYASENKIKHVVFRIKSPGGSVKTANEIADLIKKYQNEITFHVIVEEGISASIWVIFACKNIYVVDNATLGGAIAYSVDSTGSYDVDLKFNSILTAKICAMAETNGHSPALVKAMTTTSASVYKWKDRQGVVQISDTRPPANEVKDDQITTLDGYNSVLTLTAKQCVEIGFAHHLKTGKASEIGPMIAAKNWTKASDFPSEVRTMYSLLNVLHSESLKYRGQGLPGTLAGEKILDAFLIIEKNDPGRTIKFWDPSTKKYIVQSVPKWRESCVKALAAWQTINTEVKRMNYATKNPVEKPVVKQAGESKSAFMRRWQEQQSRRPVVSGDKVKIDNEVEGYLFDQMARVREVMKEGYPSPVEETR